MDNSNKIKQQVADNIVLELRVEQLLEKPELLTRERIQELHQIRDLLHTTQDILKALSDLDRLFKKG